MKLFLISIAFIFSGFANASELRISCGVFPYENIYAKIQDKYEKESGNKIVYVTPRESTGADLTLTNILTGKAELGTAAGAWDEWKKIALEKKVATADELEMIKARVIGSDVMKVVAHPSNGVQKVSMADLARIFNGEMRNWKELGGADLPIVVALQTTYPATNNFFKKFVLKDAGFTSNVIMEKTLPAMLQKISSTKGAVGFTSAKIENGKLIEITTPDVIGRPITAITKGIPSEKVLKFFEFIKQN